MVFLLVFLSLMLSFSVCTVLSCFLWPYRRQLLHRLILSIQVTYAVWAFSVITVLVIDDMSVKIFLTHMRQLILPPLCATWALVGTAIFLPKLWGKVRRWYGVLYLFPAVVIVANALSMMGFPFAKEWIFFNFRLVDGFQGLPIFERSPLQKANLMYSFFWIFALYGVCFWVMATQKGPRRWHAFVMFLASLVPVGAEILGQTVFKLQPQFMQLTVAGIWPSMLALNYAVARGDVLEISTLAQRSVFDHLPNPVIVLNTHGEFWDCNQAAKKILELSEDDIGQRASQIPVIQEIIDCAESFAYAGRTFRIVEHKVQLKKKGPETAKIYVLMDVTDLEESNRTLRELNAQILQMTRFSRKVQTVLSHDLTGSLSGVQMLLTGVIGQMRKSEDQSSVESLQRIHDANKSSMGLLRDVLAWSHEDESQRGIDFNGRVKAAIEQLSPQLLQKNIQLHTALPAHEILLSGSGKVLEAVVRNILSNAIRFSPREGVVHVTGRMLERHVELSIQDYGLGMSQELIDELFSSKAPSMAAGGGFGIGLHFTKDFITQMGGVLSIESAEGEGTLVRVQLPLFG
ncbi:two-component hybrid sensor and regulator [Bdellovibrio bacteriovorus]|uniref:ATP-binding protein n=1 Tax=Bdellovibrio bacteriovorus TaxID=959 RepID=UPI00045BF5AE|nr:ATP-binding protein [Bdellovibrio bacteriovorus]AHZ85328.1 two-component hybrid sensor and regulator [Bdellovibrio bacteriovorus]